MLLVLAWLPVAFTAWYVLAPVILAPAQWLATLVARGAFGDLVRGVDASGATLSFVTTLKAGRADVSGVLTVDVNMLLYSFGLPLFAALTLAAGEPRRARTLLVGYATILPFVAWGVIADFLKNIAVTAPAMIASQAGFSALDRDIIALAYQFGALILPSVVPAVAWVLTHRAFLERMRAAHGGG